MDLSARKTAPNPQPANAGRELTTHKLVQDAWTKIAGRWDEAGGDSLKLLHCIMEIETGHELSLEAFTVDVTVAEMVKAIVSGQATGQVARPQAWCASDPFPVARVHRLRSEHGVLCSGPGQGRPGHPDQIPRPPKHPRRRGHGYRHGRRSRRADPSDPARRPCPPSRPFAWWGGGVRSCGTAAGSGAVRQVPRNSRYVHRERAPRLLGDAHPHIAADADQSRQRLPDRLPGPCKRYRRNR